MLYILLFLILLLILFIYISTKDVLSPSLLLCGVFFVSVFCAILGNRRWKMDFSANAVIVIFFGLFFIILGEMVARKFVPQRMATSRLNDDCQLVYSKKMIFIGSAFCVTTVYIFYQRMLEIALKYGYSGTNMLEYARLGLINYNESIGTACAILSTLARCIGLVCMAVFIYDFLRCPQKILAIKKNFGLIIPIGSAFLLEYLGTSRIGFIRIFVILFFLLFDLVRRRQKINLTKIAFSGILVVCLFLYVFLAIGEARGQTSNVILIYIGSSIIAFNSWLSNVWMGKISSPLGSESFVGIHDFLNRFFTYEHSGWFYEFVWFADGSSTNIYTGFRAWIADFGVLGYLLICLLTGITFGYVYLKISKRKNTYNTLLCKLFYGYFLYYLICLFIAPELTSSFLSVTQILDFFFIFIAYWLIVKRGKKQNETIISK